MNIELQQGELTAPQQVKVGVVTSRFNSSITELLEQAALSKLTELGFRPEQIIRVRVPGAVEIPLAAKWLLNDGCAGVVALGAVIKGDTWHFEYVCQSVERGLTQLQLETGKPVASGVLTTYTEDQALARAGGEHGNKGEDVAAVLVEMLQLQKALSLNNPLKQKESPL